MDDYISKRVALYALAKEMPSLTTPDGCGEFDHDIQIADEAFVDSMHVIYDLPSADVVEVVRCKDCKRYIRHDKRCGFWNYGVRQDDWCSYGERKDGEQNVEIH